MGDARSGTRSVATRLRESLAASGLSPAHALTLLKAFRRDASENRCETADDLLAYCRRSADPVGRYLLDLHQEDPALYPASDALCTALQILNHVQDCGRDRRELDRVYLPVRWLAEGRHGRDPRSTRRPFRLPLRRVLDRTLDLADAALVSAATFARPAPGSPPRRRSGGDREPGPFACPEGCARATRSHGASPPRDWTSLVRGARASECCSGEVRK